MKPAATIGDKHVCPIHGHSPSTIVSGSGLLMVNGKLTACIGDKVGCGATIIEGTPVAMAGGQLVAFLGSKTSHGGTIVSGDSDLMVDTGMASVVGGLDEGIAELLEKFLFTSTLSLKDTQGSTLSDCPYCIEDKSGNIIASGTTDSGGNIKNMDSGEKEDVYKVYVGFTALDRMGGE